MDTSDTHIYYDISLFNNDVSGDMPVNINFSETRSGGSLIDIPENYHFSIVRFELDSCKLPVFIPQTKISAQSATPGTYTYNGANDLIYTFAIETISDVDNSSIAIYKGRVQYVPTNLNIDPNLLSTSDLSNEYHFIYNFNQWIDMVNTCLIKIFSDIPNIQKNTSAKPPFFTYNSSTGLVSLYTTTDYIDVGFRKRMNIYWNAPTETIFNGFHTTQVTTALGAIIDTKAPVDSGSHSSVYYKMNVRNPYNVNLVSLGEVGATSYFISNTQAYPSLPMCSPIQNIVFTTSGTLPIVNSQQSSPIIFSSKGDCSLQGRADNISPILTDFIVPLQTGNEYKTKINYSPTIYRLIDLKGNAPLKCCDLQVFWKSKVDAKLHPFVLGSQCGASCKILFRRKGFNSM